MGTEGSRRYKVEWLKEKIDTFFKKRPEGSISKKKLLAEFELQTYAARRTGLEILNALEDMNFISVEGDIITR